MSSQSGFQLNAETASKCAAPGKQRPLTVKAVTKPVEEKCTGALGSCLAKVSSTIASKVWKRQANTHVTKARGAGLESSLAVLAERQIRTSNQQIVNNINLRGVMGWEGGGN